MLVEREAPMVAYGAFAWLQIENGHARINVFFLLEPFTASMTSRLIVLLGSHGHQLGGDER